jgi:VCBS repeat-containing protein
MPGAIVVAQARSNEAAVSIRAAGTGVLTLNRPQGGNVVTFDADDYAIIDLRFIANQWVALVQIGRTLKIVFGDGSFIELLNFFPHSLVPEASWNDKNHTGSTTGEAVASSDVVVRTTDTLFLSSLDFARNYWVTKSSGTIVGPTGDSGVTGGSGSEVLPSSLDSIALSFPLDLSTPGFPPAPFAPGSELLVPPVPPTLVVSRPEPPSPEPLPPEPTPPAANNAPFITAGLASGNTTEDASPPAASGIIEFADVDSGDVHVVSVTPGGPDYVGTFTASLSNAAGGGTVTWQYSSDPADLQFLAEGQQLVQTYTVVIDDGHGGTVSQVVTITITGTNDAPVAVADSNVGDAVIESGVEAGNVPFPGDPLAAGNVLANDTDVDAGDTRTVSAVNGSAANLGIAVVGVYGSLTLVADGTWTYALDNADPDTDALAQGEAATDSFTYTLEDANGATATTTLTIAITGTNDAATITGDVTGAVTEAGGIDNAIPGIPTDTGDLNATDVDNDPDDAWQAVAAGAATANGYGTYELSATGV